MHSISSIKHTLFGWSILTNKHALDASTDDHREHKQTVRRQHHSMVLMISRPGAEVTSTYLHLPLCIKINKLVKWCQTFGPGQRFRMTKLASRCQNLATAHCFACSTPAAGLAVVPPAVIPLLLSELLTLQPLYLFRF